MPSVLTFLCCEKAIISIEGPISLINVFHELKIASIGEAGAELPPDTAIPFPWAAVTIWTRDDGDADQTFVQRNIVRGPRGSTLIESAMEFSFVGQHHRQIAKYLAFPFEGPGTYVVEADWAPLGSSRWSEAGRWRIAVKREPTNPAEATIIPGVPRHD